jgi:hypothetical protein
VRRRACTFLVAMAGLLAAAPAASATPVTFPADPGFSTVGTWTATTTGCALLCSLTATNPATGGNPGANALVSYATLANVLGTANGTEDITSASFTWQGASPASATLHVDRRTSIATLLSVNGSAGALLQLVDVTAGTTTAIKSLAYTTDTPAWTGGDYAVPASLLMAGHAYRLQIRTSFTAAVAVLGGATVAYDNVRLRATRQAATLGGTVVGTPTQTTVALGATADTQGVDATYHVEYGTTTSYGSQTGDQTLTAANSPGAINVNVSSLSPGTTYHARLAITTDAGTTYGPDVTFATAAVAAPPAPPVPAVGTVTATTPDARDADLTAMVDASAVSGAQYRFEYGTTAAYGNTTTLTAVPAAGASGWSVLSTSLSSLVPGTTYHARVAVLAGGTWTYGADATFATPAAVAPTVGAPSVTATRTDAQVAASITPHGSDTTWTVEWGTTDAYGNTSDGVVIPAGEDPVRAVYDLTGLTADTDYHFRFVATSADGTTRGADTVLHTSADAAVPTTVPTVDDPAASAITATAAHVAATVDVNGESGATYRFAYGTTTAYGAQTMETAVPAAGSDGTSAIAASLTGLTAATTYHLRASVKVNGVWTDGNDVTFRTDAAPSTPSAPGTPAPTSTGDGGTTEAEGSQDTTPTDTTTTPTDTTTTPTDTTNNSAATTATTPVATPAATPATPTATTTTTAVAPACRGVAITQRSRGIRVGLDAFVTATAPLRITPGARAGRVTRVTIDGRLVKATIKGRTASLAVALLRAGRHTIVVGTGAKAARVTVTVGACRPTLALWRKGAKAGIALTVVPGTKAATIAVPQAYAAALKGATVTVRSGRTTKAIKNAKVINNAVAVTALPAGATSIRIAFPTGTRAPRAAGVTATVTTPAGKAARLTARKR